MRNAYNWPHKIISFVQKTPTILESIAHFLKYLSIYLSDKSFKKYLTMSFSVLKTGHLIQECHVQLLHRYLIFKKVTFCYTLSAISFVTSNTTATKSIGIIFANSMNRALVAVVSARLLDICVVAKHCRIEDQTFILHVITIVFTYPWFSLKISLR